MNGTTQTQDLPARAGDQRESNFLTPPVNIAATNDEYLIEVEMPGVDKDGLEVTVDGSELTVIGRRKPELPDGELYYAESPLADYRRVFELSPDIDTSKIQAEMHQGVLKLHLPKSETAKPRKIEIAG